jgi:hypothetical protein
VKPLKIHGTDGKVRAVKLGEHIPEVESWKDNIRHFNLTRGLIKEVDVAPKGALAAPPAVTAAIAAAARAAKLAAEAEAAKTAKAARVVAEAEAAKAELELAKAATAAATAAAAAKAAEAKPEDDLFSDEKTGAVKGK